MKISLGWLSDYVALPASLPDLESVLTSAGLTVEGVEERGADFPHMVVARILESNPHPNADRLSVCRVEDGTPVPRQIVCGAKNFRVGDKVPLALPGALLPGDFKIKVGKLRGVESEGMLCSAKELRLADDAEGLLILPADAEVGSRISEIFPPDTILELEVTPNRPDWLCHIGVAREIAAFTGMPLRVPVIEIPATCPSEHIAIQDAGGCAFYSLVRVSGVRVGPSPAWLRQRLEGVGLRSINNVVDITNLVLMETGQPLHAFDAAKVEGPICVRPALHGETIEALDGVTYSLHGGELLIADARSPLALAGIMGGAASGVGETTSDVLLESALFHPSHIRRTARALGLSSDSSYRFERGVDPQGVLPASARALALLQSLANGTPEEAIRIAGALPTASQAIPFRPQRCRDLLGAAFTDEEMFGALKCFGLRQEGEGWVPPSFRLDLAREADLIEEVARRIGMERIPSRIAAAPAPASPADHRQDRLAKMRHSLAELGFFEARSGTLVPARPEAILLRNPMGEEQAALRPSLLPGLLDALQRNLHAGERLIRLFEAGKIYCTSEPEERLCVALAASGPIHEPHWRSSGVRSFDVFDLKGLIGRLLGEVHVASAAPDGTFGLRALIEINGRPIGTLGQLQPSLARQLDARAPVLIAEFELGAHPDSECLYRPIPPYPSSVRDIAILAPLQLPFSNVERAIRDAREPLLTSVHLFDVFHDPTGVRLAADARSLAISLTFAAHDRTLQAVEVQEATDRIKQHLKDQLGVGFRE